LKKGEPNDSTNFGSHANPGIGSHFGQTKFLAIHSASPKRRRLEAAANCSFVRPQKERRRNAAVRPSSPIRPQMEKDRAAAVRRDGRKLVKGEMRPYKLAIHTAASGIRSALPQNS
ncbi:MAG: hypothetical protein IKH41_01190, partial [Clostridia bacterium]|nr:hypothetical protein [Clostridia bacterium]